MACAACAAVSFGVQQEELSIGSITSLQQLICAPFTVIVSLVSPHRAPGVSFNQNSTLAMPRAALVLAIDSLAFFTVPVSARMASMVSGITMAWLSTM